jgi:hypothetical protein
MSRSSRSFVRARRHRPAARHVRRLPAHLALDVHFCQPLDQFLFENIEFSAPSGDPLQYHGIRHEGDRRNRDGSRGLEPPRTTLTDDLQHRHLVTTSTSVHEGCHASPQSSRFSMVDLHFRPSPSQPAVPSDQRRPRPSEPDERGTSFVSVGTGLRQIAGAGAALITSASNPTAPPTAGTRRHQAGSANIESQTAGPGRHLPAWRRCIRHRIETATSVTFSGRGGQDDTRRYEPRQSPRQRSGARHLPLDHMDRLSRRSLAASPNRPPTPPLVASELGTCPAIPCRETESPRSASRPGAFRTCARRDSNP